MTAVHDDSKGASRMVITMKEEASLSRLWRMIQPLPLAASIACMQAHFEPPGPCADSRPLKTEGRMDVRLPSVTTIPPLREELLFSSSPTQQLA